MDAKLPPKSRVGIILRHPRRKDGWSHAHNDRVISDGIDFIEENFLSIDQDDIRKYWRGGEKTARKSSFEIHSEGICGMAQEWINTVTAILSSGIRKGGETDSMASQLVTHATVNGAEYMELKSKNGVSIEVLVWKDGSGVKVDGSCISAISADTLREINLY